MTQDSQGRYQTPDEISATGAIASAARTTSTNGTAFNTVNIDAVVGVLTVTTVTGTNPTLDVVLQTTTDGTNYYTADSFVQKTAAATADSKAFGPLGDLSRWAWTIGGTGTPTFTFDISATLDRDA